MQNCNGKYIQFIDSDDEALPNKISEQLKTLESNKKLLMTYGTTLVGEKDENMVILGRTNKAKQKIAPLFLICLLDYIQYIMEKNIYRKILGSHYLDQKTCF